MKIRTSDTVIITTGSDKGKKGKVVKADPKTNSVLIEGVNIKTKYIKSGDKKEMIKKEFPIHVSNVAIVDPKKGTATKVKIERSEKGKPSRIAKLSGTKL